MPKSKSKQMGHVRLRRNEAIPSQFNLTGCGRTRITESAIALSVRKGGPPAGFEVMDEAPTVEAVARGERTAEAEKKASKKKAPKKAVRGRPPKRARKTA